MRLLLVEDDAGLAAELQKTLKSSGFVLDHASDGITGEALGADESYDAIVLDLGLPGRPGLEVLCHWRSRGVTTPVLVLTARDTWHERVDGLKAGADDYLGKPFHLEELIARIHALTRRATGNLRRTLEVGGLCLDEDQQQAILADGIAHELTGTEFRLLRYLMLHPNQILSKPQIMDHVYELEADRGSNLIEVYVRRLREKIGRGRIRTLRGQGYLFPRQ
ncbi:response regulator transcription factor [Thiorhodovibrio frisius]|uniref:Response regulator with CheY-like receiver domain and winged-helix DNA-binding domain n=1 Tax=Thiorhodovibrio frisius TaxID=631362 RepID=H8Z5P0_9GAMM|nr:response regulator transcription factor [Thiorhodovibrio frisius]EIC19524.1 response regulator with CheY-like receiver domain and winged-helix DNA-binding domain [Thiorhodovibrio frisius]WPL20513.1 Transcriptional regulatory protein QseB [Thiorhodovibrio frisius]